MKKLSEIKSLQKFPVCERKLISDLLIELGQAEPDNIFTNCYFEEPKYQIGDIWRVCYSTGEGATIKITHLDSPSMCRGIKVYKTGGTYKNASIVESNLIGEELLWRDPK